ncbi:MFS transporter [Kribbella catacumbae]|uniref:MFS transporter n=1 Tax=Kribbella catacumbae TaxID=460086 RepID=UPI00047660CA|nr:MFS transporter [Kribbella catacumbae]
MSWVRWPRTTIASRAVGAFVYAGFWAVAAVTALGLVPDHRRGRAMSIVAGGLTTVPRTTPDRASAPRISSELRAMTNPRLWLAYSTPALSTGALLVTFSYFAPLLAAPKAAPRKVEVTCATGN